MESTTNQGNKAVLMELFNQLLETSQSAGESTISKDEKLKAAYALNLCTVSVSQIIDYNDVNFLEHEYEAILNNLNLEEMPKDEALLHILKQLLDVITYFRIQEGERKLLEKEYQQKMKNAIWNAVPNIGLIVAGGNPITMAISLASQVGIGYMNYRKEKAQIGLEQERKEWELQRSAMEQLNGLRRELFDTAWRLAEKYQFKDEYRLTERQISQFNRILLDADDLRRYERLYYIQNKFEAYPPFWYYLGNAANAVYQNEDAYEKEIREEYKTHAKEAFETFLSITKTNLLREDQLEASCALELFDILEDCERDKKINLLERAKKASGNAFDVLEICALSYLKIGETSEAAKLFRMLVNEDYNTSVNAQILSKIYVSQTLNEDNNDSRKQYKTLESRVGSACLFPMPPTNANRRFSEAYFIQKQQENLQDAYVSALTGFIYKYAEKYDMLCNSSGDISNEMVELLEQMSTSLRTIMPDERSFLLPLQDTLARTRKDFQAMLTCDKAGVQRNPKLSFQMIVGDAYKKLASDIKKQINCIDAMNLISDVESNLEKFCIDNNLQAYPKRQSPVMQHQGSIASSIFCDQFENQKNRSSQIDECLDIIKQIADEKSILVNKNKKENVYFYTRGEHFFNDYIRQNGDFFRSDDSIIAIINDRSFKDQDLIISISGIYFLDNKKRCYFMKYKNVAPNYIQDGIQFGKSTYKNASVNMSALHDLTNALSDVQRKYDKTSDNNGVSNFIDSISHIIKSTDKAYDSLKTQCNQKEEIAKLGDLSEPIEYLKDEEFYEILATVRFTPLHVGSYCTVKGMDMYQVEKISLYGPIDEVKPGATARFRLRIVK